MHIILADPNQKALWALRTLLDEEPDIEVIGEATNAQRLQSLAENSSVDMVLMDRRLPGARIGAQIEALHALEPRPAVIVMSSDSEDGRYVLNAGADAFLSKGEGPDWMLRVLRHYAERMPDSNNLES